MRNGATRRSRPVRLLILALLGLAGNFAPQEEEATTGRRLYQTHCWSCHGTSGDGQGPLAADLTPAPADFRSGRFFLKTTGRGHAPSDADLAETIRKGVPGTAMPAWDLTERDIRALIRYLRKLSPHLEGEPSPAKVSLPVKPAIDDRKGRKGSRLFIKARCTTCHGPEGKGDGGLSMALNLNARNLTEGHTFKHGDSVEEIFRTITYGLDGTAMGGYRDLLTTEERWLIANRIHLQAQIFKVKPETVSVSRGEEIVRGKGRCMTCHQANGEGYSTRGPDFIKIAEKTPEYVIQSIVNPSAKVVDGYSDDVMPRVNHEVIFLSPEEIQSAAAYILSLHLRKKEKEEDEKEKVDIQAVRDAYAKLAPVFVAAPPFPIKGDPNRGLAVFMGKGMCHKCHHVLGQGKPIFDLTNIATYQSARQIRLSIVDPGRAFTAGHRTVKLRTTGNRSLAGIVRKDTDEGVWLEIAEYDVRFFPKASISSVEPKIVSTMPGDYEKTLTAGELDDLLAFLMDPAAAVPPKPTPRPYHDPTQRTKPGPALKNIFHMVTPQYLRGKWLALAELLKNMNPEKDPLVRDKNATRKVSAQMLLSVQPAREDVEAVLAYLASISEGEAPKVEWEIDFSKSLMKMTRDEQTLLSRQMSAGMMLFNRSNCTACHVKRPGQTLAFQGPFIGDMMQKYDRNWLYRFVGDHGYRFTEKQRRELVTYMLFDPGGIREKKWVPGKVDSSLVEEGRRAIQLYRCNICHDIEGIPEILAPPKPQPEPKDEFSRLIAKHSCLACHKVGHQGGAYGPDLTTAGSRLKEEWLVSWLADPKPVKRNTIGMPCYNLTPEESKVLAKGIRDRFTAHWPEPRAGNAEKGRELYESKDCASCHETTATDLSTAGRRLEPAWMRLALMDPEKAMHGLQATELEDLVSFLKKKN